jgi:hypothetical protein
MDELGPDEQRCLDALRVTDTPTGADRARVRAAVLARIAGAGAGAAVGLEVGKAAAGAGAKAASAKAGGTVAAFLAPWKIGLAAVSFVVAGGVSSMWLAGSFSSTATRTATSATATAVATAPPPPLEAAPVNPVEPNANANANANANVNTEEAASATPTATVHARAHASPPPVAIPPASAAHRDDIDGELALLTEAQQALKRGDAEAALVALARHGRDYPRGALAVERDGLRAVASCEAKHADGRALAERFVAKSPRSPLVARVRATCLSP